MDALVEAYALPSPFPPSPPSLTPSFLAPSLPLSLPPFLPPPPLTSLFLPWIVHTLHNGV